MWKEQFQQVIHVSKKLSKLPLATEGCRPEKCQFHNVVFRICIVGLLFSQPTCNSSLPGSITFMLFLTWKKFETLNLSRFVGSWKELKKKQITESLVGTHSVRQTSLKGRHHHDKRIGRDRITSIPPKPQKDGKNIKQSTPTNIRLITIGSFGIWNLVPNVISHIFCLQKLLTELSWVHPILVSRKNEELQSLDSFLCSVVWSKLNLCKSTLAVSSYL